MSYEVLELGFLSIICIAMVVGVRGWCWYQDKKDSKEELRNQLEKIDGLIASLTGIKRYSPKEDVEELVEELVDWGSEIEKELAV